MPVCLHFYGKLVIKFHNKFLLIEAKIQKLCKNRRKREIIHIVCIIQLIIKVLENILKIGIYLGRY